MTETLKAYTGPYAGNLYQVVSSETGAVVRNATALEAKLWQELEELKGPPKGALDPDQVKALALLNGFKLKPQPDGQMDLNPYVYQFAEALVCSTGQPAPKPDWESALSQLKAAAVQDIRTFQRLDGGFDYLLRNVALDDYDQGYVQAMQRDVRGTLAQLNVAIKVVNP